LDGNVTKYRLVLKFILHYYYGAISGDYSCSLITQTQQQTMNFETVEVLDVAVPLRTFSFSESHIVTLKCIDPTLVGSDLHLNQIHLLKVGY